MSFDPGTTIPQVPVTLPRGGPRAKRKGRLVGMLFVAAATLLLALAAGDALAGTGIGGGGDDELYGGRGRDTLVGGAGNDFVETKDGARDYVECGPGVDVASVDFGDLVARSCETVYPG